jgi:hypothetical protein
LLRRSRSLGLVEARSNEYERYRVALDGVKVDKKPHLTRPAVVFV